MLITASPAHHAKTEVNGNLIHYSRTLEAKKLSVCPSPRADDLKSFYRIIAVNERNTPSLQTGSEERRRGPSGLRT